MKVKTDSTEHAHDMIVGMVVHWLIRHLLSKGSRVRIPV